MARLLRRSASLKRNRIADRFRRTSEFRQRLACSSQLQGCHRESPTMSKIVIKADLIGQKCMSEILSTVAKLEGIKSMDIDQDKCTLTVVGTVDPVCVAQELRKACFAAAIVSVEDDKPKEKKTPCQEACEKTCKDKCEKMACCKDCEKACKDKCEKACKDVSCCDDKGPCCNNNNGYPCSTPPAGFYSGYGYGVRGPPVGYGYECYEERSPGGQCTVQ
ncbi:hypothetical protein BRADI_2g08800v3 [Brachypodium distachyon]|uniref:HMA domain-containing protein n=1 Tax=Brachypodium distachyon TaxID=15368 RepID=A0A2K2D7L5_BRADI|nr:hypothetical protein BRADI_2g08800v3 [Brachypodium distachyon]